MHKPHIRRGWYGLTFGLFFATIAISLPDMLPAFADSPVVQGTIKTTGGVGIANAGVELHTPDGNFNIQTTTDGSGAYVFSTTLTSGTPYVVEARTITGYNRNEPHSQNFTYQSGDAVRNYDFTFTSATKTITGRVTDSNGIAITDADVQFTPYNISGASSASGRTDMSGNYSTTVVGGAWFAQAAVNLSEYTPRWIAEEAPVRVDFASNDSTESQTVNFVVTPATGKVTATLLNSDGNKLTTSSFVADIDFRRADGVGTTRKVQQSDSSLSVYLTPGIYNICAFHTDLQGKSFDPSATTFVMTDSGDLNLGTIQAVVNTAHLKGKVVGSNGAGLGNVALIAFREGGCNQPSGSTQPDGTFDITVGPGTWTIGLSSNDTQHTQVAPVSATVANGQTATGLNITLKTLDKTISGNVVDANGTLLTSYVGSVFVQSSTKGTKAYAPVVNGAYSVKYSSAEIPGTTVLVGAEATEGSSYTGSAKAKVSIVGATATKNLTVLTFDASLSGTLLLPSGAAAANTGSPITIEAVDESGNFVSADVADSGAYTLPLAKGVWFYDYNIEQPELTDGLMNRPVGQNQLTIAAGQTVSKNLTVRQGTNTITGTVTSSTGTALPRVLVNIDNRPKLEDSGTANPANMVSLTVESNDSGVYTTKVPNGTYLVTAGDTPSVAANMLPPDGKTVTVSGGSTATANLKFEKSDATISGKITTSGVTDGGGIVSAWTDDGSAVSGPVKKDGTYSLKVTSGEVWHVDVTDLKGNKLLESSQTNLTTKIGTNAVNLAMADTGITVPGPVTKSCDADDTCTVSLPDGASVTLPPFAVDLTGTIKITLTPTIDLDKSSTDAPATLAYEVKALDNSGNAVTDLDKPAEVTIPYSQTELAKNGLVEKRLNPTYFNPDTNTWEDSGSTGLVDVAHNVATIKTEHFTKFAVTGTTKKAPKVTGFRVVSANSSTVVLELTGSNFLGTLNSTFGSVKASKVALANGKVLVTLPSKKLVSGSNTLTLTIGNGRVVYLTKTVTISKGVPSFK